jgi:hypothetical protein
MFARIYRPAKNAMQSGRGKSQVWLLEFEDPSARSIEPLMGYTSSTNTDTQVRMTFETREEAIAFAQTQGFEFQVVEPRESKRIIKAYADNFSSARRRPWTH